MCYRFALFEPQPDIEARFGAVGAFRIRERYNIAPGAPVPVIRNDAPDAIRRAEWGFVAPWDETERLANARSETLAETRSFREAFEERRCVVPASGYYEWRSRPRGANQPYLIHPVDDELFALAGLWNPATGPEEPTCTILTTAPSSSIEHLHDRMPVILEPDDEGDWLTPDDPDRLHDLLGPYPDGRLGAYAVSTKVNDPRNDSPDLVEPVDVRSQSGLEEFG